MIKKQAPADEFLSEDGIFCKRARIHFDNAEKCCQCGFELLPGEEAVEIFTNGDIIHKSCWCDYADENAAVFGLDFVYSQEG